MLFGQFNACCELQDGFVIMLLLGQHLPVVKSHVVTRFTLHVLTIELNCFLKLTLIFKNHCKVGLGFTFNLWVNQAHAQHLFSDDQVA